MKLNKFKLVSATTAITLVGGGITLPLISNSIKTNTITTNQTNNIDITANKNNASTNLQVVNSVDEIVVEDVNIIGDFGYAIVKNNGIQEVYAWGRNDNGQLGVGDRLNKPNPTKVELPVFDTNTVIKSISFDDPSSHVLLEKNGVPELYVWGGNEYGQLGLGDKDIRVSPTPLPLSAFGNGIIREIVFNYRTSYAIIDKAGGEADIYVWGANGYGQLGLGDTTPRTTPTLHPLPNTKRGWTIKQVQISSSFSYHSSFALFEKDGASSVFTWGENAKGQLGIDTTTTTPSPTEIPSWKLGNGKIISFAINIDLSYALVEWIDGGRTIRTIYTWGNNSHGQLGSGLEPGSHLYFPTPNPIFNGFFGSREIMDVGMFGANNTNMFAIVNVDGILRVYTWGQNDYGQISDGTTNRSSTPYAIPLEALNNGLIESYSFGSYNAMVVVKVDNKQQVFVWGRNDAGCLGLNSTANILIPTRLNNSLFNESDIVLPKSRNNTNNTMFSLQKDGIKSYYISGINTYGQLGDGATGNRSVHVRALPKKTTELSIKESEKITILKANISATDAMQSIISSDILSRTALEKYVDLSGFPPGAKLSIDTDKTKIDYELGIIDLVINTTSYYGQLSYIAVEGDKQFSITIPGFRPIKDFPIIAKTAPTLNAIQFYDYVIASDKTNRTFLEQYLDLSCIPLDAEIVIEPLKTTDSNKIEFILKTNKVYKNNGTATLENYEQLFSFNFDQNTTPIQKDSSSIGLDSTVIIGLIIGGCVLAVIILTSIYAFAHKTKYY